MSWDAVKFTDLDSFLSVTEERGYNGELKDLIFEQNKPPYCSAYFIPVHRLSERFDLESIDEFGGTMARVEVIHYLGTERFTADFMIFPLSLTGYVEVGIPTPTTFAQQMESTNWTTGEMNYVINLEDGGGKEFYLTVEGELIGLSSASPEQPQEFKTFKLTAKRIDQLKPKYPATCQLYAVERREFDKRRQMLQEENEKPKGDVENQPE